MKKSTRKNGSCRKPHVSTGTREQTNCPPDLTRSVKEGLLQEIRAFKSKSAQKIARRAIEDGAKSAPNIEAYVQWREQRAQFPEPVEANPDILSDEDGIKYLPSKEDSAMAILLAEVRQLFTPRERQAWNLVMRHSMSYQEAADLLSISVSTVQSYVDRARAKFIQYLEAKK